jgi:hypothetical protein
MKSAIVHSYRRAFRAHSLLELELGPDGPRSCKKEMRQESWDQKDF